MLACRMAYFEQKGRLEAVGDLIAEVKSHYISQVVQQSYVLVLGLDVLGNPYGLVKDFTRGFGDFFYEPIMGSIQGPEEFAGGLAKGAQSLLGHIVGECLLMHLILTQWALNFWKIKILQQLLPQMIR